MTKEQFQDIEARLQKWREARGLSVEDQKANFEVNYTEELLEFFKAQRDGNEHAIIDSLCDMCIVAINAGHDYESFVSVSSRSMGSLALNALAFDDIDLTISAIYLLGYDPYKCLIETLEELESRSGAWNEKEGKWIKDEGAYTAEEAIEKLEKVFSEAKKTGEDNKWFYFTCFEGLRYVKISRKKIKKWYKADYSKCRLKA